MGSFNILAVSGTLFYMTVAFALPQSAPTRPGKVLSAEGATCVAVTEETHNGHSITAARFMDENGMMVFITNVHPGETFDVPRCTSDQLKPYCVLMEKVKTQSDKAHDVYSVTTVDLNHKVLAVEEIMVPVGSSEPPKEDLPLPLCPIFEK